MILPNENEMENLRALLELARREDFGGGDVTCALLPEDVQAAGRFVARQELVVCGCAMLETIASAYDERIDTKVRVADGQKIGSGEILAQWTGPARSVLAAERVALNFLQRLCGIATVTRKYVDAVADTDAEIYDTRKTIPAWRHLEKFAVRCGGGRNHRMGLFDAVLVKDNHLAVLARAGVDDPISAIARGFAKARRKLGPDGFVEVEVDTLDQLKTVLPLGADVILLDNMPVEQLRKAVSMRDNAGLKGCVVLEASGGITLESIGEVARSGVERIAVGAITHSAPSVDIGLDMEFE